MKIKKTSKSLLASLLSICIIISTFVITAVAVVTPQSDVWDGSVADDYAEGTGVSGDPFIITTAEELALLAKTALENGASTEGKYYKLGANIVLNGSLDVSPRAWYAQTDDSMANDVGFSGNLDGNGYTVSGIYVNNPYIGRCGLFWRMNAGATVKNLGITNSSLCAYFAGGIAGDLVNVAGKESLIQNCYVDDTVTVNAKNGSGGIIGGSDAKSTIKNCYSLATLLARAGVVDEIGGIVGNKWSSPKLTITGCYTNYSKLAKTAWETPVNSYCVTDTLTSEMMQGEEAMANMPGLAWDTAFIITDSYPVLKTFVDWNGDVADEFAEGDGTQQNPYEISNANELALLAKTSLDDGASTEGKYYKLVNDIVINSVVTAASNPKVWYSHWSGTGFCGNFNGNGYTVSGIYVSSNSGNSGLFYRAQAGATIKNVGVINSSINGSYVGAIVGLVNNVDGKTAVIDNCYSGADVTIAARDAGGGILGATGGTANVTNCYSLASITAPEGKVGGIAGQQWSKQLKIIGCYTNNNSLYGTTTWKTVTSSYCVTDTPEELTSEMMQGEAAITNMPGLEWDTMFITTDSYPILKVFVDWNGDVAKRFAAGYGTERQPFEISNSNELALLAKTALEDGASTDGKYYKLTKDILINTKVTAALSPKVWYSHWSGVGFCGNFDGNGHTVSGIYVSSASGNSGLFYRASAGATIKNVGVINSSINGSYTGAIVGLVNNVDGKTAVIDNCYSGADVTISATSAGGGILGATGGTANVTNCYSLASITAPEGEVGGIAGRQWSKQLKIIGCYTNNNTLYGDTTWKTVTSSYCVTDTPEELTSEMMQGEAAITNMPDLDWVDTFVITDTYPILSVFEYEVFDGVWDGTTADDYGAGDGSRENPYQISNGAELAKLANDTDTGGKYYEITADIYLNDIRKPHWKYIANSWYSSNWTGVDRDSFSGYLNGNNHTVYGLYCNATGKNTYTGLFECLSYNAVILGVNIDDSYLKATFVGAIAGREFAPAEGRIKIANCFIGSGVEMTTNGNGDSTAIGGVIGRGDGGIDIVNCGFTGTLIGSDADRTNGILGDTWVDNVSSITNCYTLNYHISRQWYKVAFVNVYTTADEYNCYNKSDIAFVSDEDSLKGDDAQDTLAFDFDRIWQTNENGFPTLRDGNNGDVNLDGFINGYDVAALRNDLLDVENTFGADANNDEIFDIRDLVNIAKYCCDNNIFTLKVLSIGNSFSQDSHAYLSRIAHSCKDDIKAVNLYYPGCQLGMHWDNYQNNTAAYDCEINGVNQGKITISEALRMEDWDIITFQQASSLSDNYSTYQPYLNNLVSEAKKICGNAEIYIHETWSYVDGDTSSTSAVFTKYDNSPSAMYLAIKAAYEQAATAIGAPIIPSGDVIQYLRDNIPVFNVETGSVSLSADDGIHLSRPEGRYAAALVWYSTLCGKDVREVKFAPGGTDKDLINTIKNAVYAALNQ